LEFLPYVNLAPSYKRFDSYTFNLVGSNDDHIESSCNVHGIQYIPPRERPGLKIQNFEGVELEVVGLERRVLLPYIEVGNSEYRAQNIVKCVAFGILPNPTEDFTNDLAQRSDDMVPAKEPQATVMTVEDVLIVDDSDLDEELELSEEDNDQEEADGVNGIDEQDEDDDINGIDEQDAEDEDDDQPLRREPTPIPDTTATKNGVVEVVVFDDEEEENADAMRARKAYWRRLSTSPINSANSFANDLGNSSPHIAAHDAFSSLSEPSTESSLSEQSTISEPGSIDIEVDVTQLTFTQNGNGTNNRKRDADTALFEESSDEEEQDRTQEKSEDSASIVPPSKRRAVGNDEHVHFALPVEHETDEQRKERRRVERVGRYSRGLGFVQGLVVGAISTFALLVYSAPPPAI